MSWAQRDGVTDWLCARCRRVRPVGEFRPFRRRLLSGSVAAYRDSYCLPCRRAHNAAAHARWMAKDPDHFRAAAERRAAKARARTAADRAARAEVVRGLVDRLWREHFGRDDGALAAALPACRRAVREWRTGAVTTITPRTERKVCDLAGRLLGS